MPSLRMGGGGYTVVDWGQKIGFVWQSDKRWFVHPTGSTKALDLDGHRTRKEAVAALMAYLKETTNDR